MREAGKYLLGAILAAVLLWVVFRGVEPRRLLEALRGASVAGLVAGAVVMTAHNVFRVLRWRLLLTPVRTAVPFRPMFASVMVGYLTTWVLPGRLGEVVRPALLSSREGLPLGPCLGTVVADRVLDGAAIVVLFALGLLVTPLEGEASLHAAALRTTALVMLGATLVPLAGLLGVSRIRGRIDGWAADRHGLLGWLARTLSSFAHGTEALRRPSLLLLAGLHSILAWLTISAGTWIGIRASGVSVPFPAVAVMMPLLAFGVAVPTPGGAGGYHAAMAFGLQVLFAVPRDAAVATGVLMHLVVVVPVVVVGLVLLRTERISWHDIRGIAAEVRQIGSRSSAGSDGSTGGTS